MKLLTRALLAFAAFLCLSPLNGQVVGTNQSTTGGGGSSAFNALTAGTNNTAAMVVGTGASLTPTGTGTLTANTLTNGATISGLNAISFPTQDSTLGASIGIGANALSGLTGSQPYQDVAVGYNTLTGAAGVNNTANVAVGYGALQLCCTGVGHNNIAVGPQALAAATSADGNIGIGFRALYALGAAPGSYNISIGNQSFLTLTTGTQNVGIGRQIAPLATTASNNTVIGYQVGPTNLTTGSGNILIGTDSSTDLSTGGASNNLNLGRAITATNLQNNTNTGGVPTITIAGPVNLLTAGVTIPNPTGSSTLGLEWSIGATTINDTSAGGALANYTAVNVGQPTFTATNPVTLTNAVTMRLAAPVCGTNVTCTNTYALVAGAGINVTAGTVATPNLTVSNAATFSGPSVVPTGGSLGATGSGTITATSLSALTGLPNIATQTILGNGSGGLASPVALTLGSNLVATSTTLGTTQPINAQTGTSYAIATTDGGKLLTFNNAGAVAVSLSQANTAGFTAGFSFDAENLGNGTVTITPAASTINGAATLTLAKNTGCTVTSDGTNYQLSACTALSGGSTGANPTGTVGLSAVNGSATTFLRSDAAPALSQAIVPTWTGVHTFSATPVFNAGTSSNGISTITIAPAANTSTDGYICQDTTAASLGNQQFSCRIRLTGQGWQTNTSASQPVDWIIENQPVQGAANPFPLLVFSSQVNGGGYTSQFTFTPGGYLNGVNGLNLQVAGNNKMGFATGYVNLYVPLVSNAAVFTIASGTGACATTSTKVGGAVAGHFTCTGATAASTVTLTLPTVPNAYAGCSGRDVTTPTTVTQTGALSTTSVTLTLTSVTANDVIQFSCPLAY